MRFYPLADPDFYIEYDSPWSLYCRTPNKSWKMRPEQPKHYINYYRDLEGNKMKSVEHEDLLFSVWSNTRIRPGACLPVYYGLGKRFISLQKTGPIGFKCTPMPIALKDARVVRHIIVQANKKKRATRNNKKNVKQKSKK